MVRNLKEIFDSNKCDKSSKHGYDAVYTELFEPLRNTPLNILEIGIFRGESLASWVEYFPEGTVYGIDVFTRVQPADISILQNPKVRWSKCDSMDSKVASTIWSDVEFDIIIDDGLHTPEANKLTFEAWFPRLKRGGLYIVEDVFPYERMTVAEKKHPWLMASPNVYNDSKFDTFKLAISRYTHDIYDRRELTGQPDSCLYVVKK